MRLIGGGIPMMGLGTSAPTAILHVSGGYGSNAAVIINQLNSGDLLTASASGVTKFRITNNGTASSSGRLYY